MTHAHLPAAAVAGACEAAKLRLVQQRTQLQEQHEAAHRTVTQERALSRKELSDAANYTATLIARVSLIGKLAWEVRDGTIAVSVDDFALIAMEYLEAKEDGQ
jgi:F0F1-type ATP synthase membrane subunit b/b'